MTENIVKRHVSQNSFHEYASRESQNSSGPAANLQP